MDHDTITFNPPPPTLDQNVHDLKQNKETKSQINGYLLIVINDGIEPVSDSHHSALLELGSDGGLNERVSIHVNRRGGLIHDQNPGFAEQCPGQTHQLALTNTEQPK